MHPFFFNLLRSQLHTALFHILLCLNRLRCIARVQLTTKDSLVDIPCQAVEQQGSPGAETLPLKILSLQRGQLQLTETQRKHCVMTQQPFLAILPL